MATIRTVIVNRALDERDNRIVARLKTSGFVYEVDSAWLDDETNSGFDPTELVADEQTKPSKDKPSGEAKDDEK